VKVSIQTHRKESESSYNYLKLFIELSSVRVYSIHQVILTTLNLSSLDSGREMPSEDRHTLGTGDGSLLEGHAGAV
jgi:hypothetical protein